MRWVFVWLGVFFLALSGCGDFGKKSNLGESCGKSSDCVGQLVCVGLECVLSEVMPDMVGLDDSGPKPCLVGQKISCSTSCEPAISLTGTATCLSNGQFSACQPPAAETCGNNKDDNCNGQVDEGCEDSCNPGQSKECVTACATVGAQTCVNGQWSACSGTDEVCDGKDNDCDQQIDEGLTQACNSCGIQGTIQCVNGTWTSCSAPTPTVEDCNGKDDDCDGMTDESDTGQALTKQCVTNCGVGVQYCQLNPNTNQKEWTPCDKQPSQEVCDGIDNDCNGQTDENNGAGQPCTCTTGQTQPCGSNIGNCQQGQQQCLSGLWSVCGGANYKPAEEETCDGLDNNCNNIVDDAPIDSGIIACGVSIPALNGVGECKIGLMTCQNGQLQCVGGAEQTPEICDFKDNDCDGQTDEAPMSGDQWDTPITNNTCATAAWVPDVIENQGIMYLNPTLYPDGDVDWFKVKAKELNDFCLFCGDDCEGPYTITITLKNIPVGADYDLCVYADSCSGASDSGTCEEFGIFEIGTTPETYTTVWDGTCGGNEDKDFYVKVVSYSSPSECTPPYGLDFQVTAP